jgi:dipeptidase D
MSIRNLEPTALWNHFADLNAVPRPSKKEERVVEFMMNFGKSLGLETIKDSIDNVIIKKPATSGMENRQTVVLQSHLDMVHQKNGDTIFDFDAQGIEMLTEGDWVTANGTTLGADNGIGVATIMALLASKEIPHPAIEALFTIDEETGMTGAIHVDPKNISGTILLNLDTEDDDELSIGCAGGIDTNTSYTYTSEPSKENSTSFLITIKGLLGGHSGMDIHKGRGNANKLMTRIVRHLMDQFSVQLAAFDGGSLRNAIPREATAHLVVEKSNVAQFKSEFQIISEDIISEYKSIESYLNITFNEVEVPQTVVNSEDSVKIIDTLYAVVNGVYRMSPEIEDLVEASSSLARVIIKEGTFSTQSLQRSSVDSSKKDVANSVKASFSAMGCSVVQNGEYPGWSPNANSPILSLMKELYIKRYNEEPKIKACHAGLECGILGKHFPKMDMISFGPNIRAAHSPDEKVQISSVQKYWGYLLETLTQIPIAN